MDAKPNQILHVRGDSDSDLDALFKVAMNPAEGQALAVPMRMRKFPASFFNPPDCGSRTPQSAAHSRESSSDSSHSQLPPPPPLVASPGSPSNNGTNNATTTGMPPIQHLRAHSSPATLQQTYAVTAAAAAAAAAAVAQQQQHLRHQSYDMTADELPLPPGWDMAKTPSGQRYFLNHSTQTTTWEDPRKKVNAASLGLHAATGSAGTAAQGGGASPPTTTAAAAALNLGPLPEGWEQATTADAKHLQRATVMQNGTVVPPPAAPTPPAPSPLSATSAQSPDNHVNVQQQRQQQARLQLLQREREMLRLRQQEIMRQMEQEQQRLRQQDVLTQAMIIRQTLADAQVNGNNEVGGNGGSATGGNTNAGNGNPDLPAATTTGMDPFLGGGDFHSRQESADSGLGMGNNYSLPHTPEDFLSNSEDSADTITDDTTHASSVASNADLSSMDIGDQSNMDSDDLEPSLQELNSELLNDFEALLNNNRMDTVMWI